jgi:succinate dehydrogenase / fumarate reductase membrane anchor subunit
MRSPLSRVQHLGSAHGGTDTFWRQRLTGAANVPLVVGVIVVITLLVGRPHAEVAAVLGSPFVAALFVLLFVSVGIHMRIGMKEIVEDYVHNEGLKVTVLVASTFFSIAVATVAILAVLKLLAGF